MNNFFYIYSDLNKKELYYGFASNKPELNFKFFFSEYIGIITERLFPRKSNSFLESSTAIFSDILNGFYVIFKAAMHSFYFYIWFALLLIIIYVNYRLYMNHKRDFSKLRQMKLLIDQTGMFFYFFFPNKINLIFKYLMKT